MVSDAVVVLVTPWSECTSPMGMVFVFPPATIEVTVAKIEQVPGTETVPDGMTAFVRMSEFVVLVTIADPPQEGEVDGVPVIVSPAGMVSVKLTPVRVVLAGFCKVIVREVVPPWTKLAPRSLTTPIDRVWTMS